MAIETSRFSITPGRSLSCLISFRITWIQFSLESLRFQVITCTMWLLTLTRSSCIPFKLRRIETFQSCLTNSINFRGPLSRPWCLERISWVPHKEYSKESIHKVKISWRPHKEFIKAHLSWRDSQGQAPVWCHRMRQSKYCKRHQGQRLELITSQLKLFHRSSFKKV